MSFHLINLLLDAEPTNGGGLGVEVLFLQLISTSGPTLDPNIEDGQSIDISQGISINAIVGNQTKSVVWQVDGATVNISNNGHYIVPQRKFSLNTNTTINQIRPFDLGVGIRTLKLIPYPQENAQGNPGAAYEITVEFNNGSGLGFTPQSINVSNVAQFQSAVAIADDYDRIVCAAGTYNFTGVALNITKKIKIIGFGAGITNFTNLTGWTVTRGITVNKVRITPYPNGTLTPSGGTWISNNFGDSPCFTLSDGCEGVFIGDNEIINCNRVLEAAGSKTTSGIVVSNNKGNNFSGNRASVADLKGPTSNAYAFLNNFHTLISTTGSSNGIQFGGDANVNISEDQAFAYNVFETLDTIENAQREVHACNVYGSYTYIVGNTVKNIINFHGQADREGLYHKGNYLYAANNWVHNGGALGQEGHFSFKGTRVGGLIEWNLCTSNRAADSGQGFTVHGEIIFRNNKAVLELNSNINGGMLLHVVHQTAVSYLHDNEFIGNGAKLTRHAIADDAPGGSTMTDNVYNNIARIKTMEASGVFYKTGSGTSVNQTGGDDLQPASGTNGSAFVPAGSNWYLAHVPANEGPGWFPA